MLTGQKMQIPCPSVPADEEVCENPPKEIGDEEYDQVIIQSMMDEANRDQKGYWIRLMEEGDAHPARKQMGKVDFRNFLNMRYERTSRSSCSEIQRLNQTYDWLREFHFGWEREIFVVYTHFDHPASFVIEKLFLDHMNLSISEFEDQTSYTSKTTSRNTKYIDYYKLSQLMKDFVPLDISFFR